MISEGTVRPYHPAVSAGESKQFQTVVPDIRLAFAVPTGMI
jgi:hypothetical protein